MRGGKVPALASSPFERWCLVLVDAHWLEALAPLTPSARLGAGEKRAVAFCKKNTAILAGISDWFKAPPLFMAETTQGVHSQRRTVWHSQSRRGLLQHGGSR